MGTLDILKRNLIIFLLCIAVLPIVTCGGACACIGVAGAIKKVSAP